MKMESCTTVLKDLKLLTVVAKNFILDVCGRHGYPNFQSMLPTMLSLPLEIKLIYNLFLLISFPTPECGNAKAVTEACSEKVTFFKAVVKILEKYYFERQNAKIIIYLIINLL